MALVAKYTSLYSDLLPTFNTGYQYEVNEIYENGVYITEIYAENDFESCSFSDATDLLTVEYLKVTNNVTSFCKNNSRGMFDTCTALTYVNTEGWDTSNVTNMSHMFYNCSSLTSIDVSNWYTSGVTNMYNMFYNCNKLTQIDISNWYIKESTYMNGMLAYCSSLLSINFGDINLPHISNLDNIIYMDNALKEVTCNVSSLAKIQSQLPLRSSTNKGTIICEDLGDFDTYELDSKHWNIVSSIVSGFLVAKYTANASGIVPTFNSGYQYEINEVNNGDGTYTVEIYAYEDFSSCGFEMETQLLTIEYLKVTNKVTSMIDMFYECSSLTELDVSNWDTSNVTSMGFMFQNCKSLTELDASNWDTSNVTAMYYMFINCKSLTELNVSNWNTSNVTTMSSIFSSCKSLTELDLSNWDTSKVTAMNSAFAYCESLIELDLSNWDTSKVTSMTSMFESCSSLTELDVSNWDTSNANVDYMFYGCSALNLIKTDNTNIIKLGEQLPTRPQDDKGTVYCDKLGSIDVSSIQAKNWNVVSSFLVARYTTNASGVVPTFNSGYQYTVDEVNNDGIYTVEIYSYDDFSSCRFREEKRLLTVEYLKVTSRVIYMDYMFNACSKLTQVDVSNWDTSQVTAMNNMFESCSSLTQLDLSNFNTSKVTTMKYMFRTCSSLTQLDLSNFDTSQVTNMDYMFYKCYSKGFTKLDLSNFNVSKVTSMLSMFEYCYYLYDINLSNWNFSDTINKKYMFDDCDALRFITVDYKDLELLIPSIPTIYSGSNGIILCKDAPIDYSNSTLTSKRWALANIDPRIKAKYTANASGVVPTFNNGYQYEVNEVNNGDGTYTVKITAYEDFTSCSFNGKSNLLTVEYLKVTSQVTNMNYVFDDCKSLTQVDVSNWDTSKVTTMINMFYNCSSLTQLDLSNWNTGKVTNMSYTFSNCVSLTQLDVSNWNTSSVETMGYMFYNCKSLTQLDVSKWNTSQVQYMNQMFCTCSSLTQLNVSKWNTGKVTNMNQMFHTCSSLTQLDLSKWNISSVETMSYMFYNCPLLTEVNLNGLDLRNIQITSMFFGCNNLKTVYMKKSDYISANKIIEVLPSRSEEDMGILNLVDIDDVSQINEASANIKYWVISTEKITVNNINVGEVSISDLYIGSVGVKQIYLGDILIYENVEVVNNKVLLFNEAIGTLFLLGDGLLQHDEKNLSLIVSDEMEIVYDEEDLNLTIGGEE